MRRRQLDLADLYRPNGRYAYSNGWNLKAVAAVFIGVIPVIPGFLSAATTPGFGGTFEDPNFFESLYTNGLFFTFTVAGLAYLALTLLGGRAPEPVEAEAPRPRETVPE